MKNGSIPITYSIKANLRSNATQLYLKYRTAILEKVIKKPPQIATKKKNRKKQSSGAWYAGIVGCALLAAKFYFGQNELVRPSVALEPEREVAEASENDSNAPHAKQNLVPSGAMNSAGAREGEIRSVHQQFVPQPLMAEACRSPELYFCTRKVFNPEIKDAEDGTSENATSCISTGEDNICVQMRTIWNSTAHFQSSPDSRKSDFESGGRFNHEEYQCSFNQYGHSSNPSVTAQNANAGVSIQVEGRELAQALRSLQKDCIARAEISAPGFPGGGDESERSVAGTALEQDAQEPQDAANEEIQASPVTAEIPPEHAAQIMPPHVPSPAFVQDGQPPADGQNEVTESPVMTPPLGSNDRI